MDELLTWEEDRAEDDGPFSFCLAPGEYHKAEIGGGPPYSVRLPNNGAGAVVQDERHGLNFVAYLRDCFVCGGFPGLAREPCGLPDVILELARNLRPF